MNQIKCPHCGKEFTLNDEGYLNIINQVKTKEFTQEIHQRLEQLKLQNQKDVQIESAKVEASFVQKLTQKEQELQALKEKVNSSEQAKSLAILTAEEKLKEKLRQQESFIEQIGRASCRERV